MIDQFKRYFKITYLDAICCFSCRCIYMLFFKQETYIYYGNYAGKNVNQIEKSP